MKKRILVSRAAVEHNHETGEDTPVFTVVLDDGTQHRTFEYIILGASQGRYDASGEAGSRVWIETFDKVVLKPSNVTV